MCVLKMMCSDSLSLWTELLVLWTILKDGSTAVVNMYIVPTFQDWRQFRARSESAGVLPPGRTKYRSFGRTVVAL